MTVGVIAIFSALSIYSYKQTIGEYQKQFDSITSRSKSQADKELSKEIVKLEKQLAQGFNLAKQQQNYIEKQKTAMQERDERISTLKKHSEKIKQHFQQRERSQLAQQAAVDIEQQAEIDIEQQSVIDEHLTAIKGQKREIAQQQTAIKGQKSIIDEHLTAIKGQKREIAQQQTMITKQQSEIVQQRSEIDLLRLKKSPVPKNHPATQNYLTILKQAISQMETAVTVYLTDSSTDNITLFASYANQAQTAINQLSDKSPQSKALSKAIHEQLKHFQAIADAEERWGLTTKDGTRGQMVHAQSNLEQQIKPFDLEMVRALVVEIRRSEKEYRLHWKKKYRQKHRRLSVKLQETVRPVGKPLISIQESIATYNKAFLQFVKESLSGTANKATIKSLNSSAEAMERGIARQRIPGIFRLFAETRKNAMQNREQELNKGVDLLEASINSSTISDSKKKDLYKSLTAFRNAFMRQKSRKAEMEQISSALKPAVKKTGRLMADLLTTSIQSDEHPLLAPLSIDRPAKKLSEVKHYISEPISFETTSMQSYQLRQPPEQLPSELNLKPLDSPAPMPHADLSVFSTATKKKSTYQEKSRSSNKASDQALQKKSVMVPAWIAIGLLFGAILAWVSSRSIASGPKQLALELAELSSPDGRVNLSGRLPTNSKNLGPLANQINTTLGAIDSTMHQAEKGAKKISGKVGVLTETSTAMLSKSEELDSQFRNMSDTAANSNTSIEAISQTVANAMESLNVVTESAVNVDQNMVHIATAIDEANTNLASVASTTQNSAENINQLQDNAEQFHDKIAASATEVGKIAEGLNGVIALCHTANKESQQANELAQSNSIMMEKLVKSTGEIEDMVEIINNIAEQTNMLALNAAVEAAGAGDAGKGFAVVANEVKDLAKQTANVTQMIAEKVEGIQSHAKEGREQASNVKERIEQIDKSNDEIMFTMNVQGANVTSIANSISSISEESQEFTSSISACNKNFLAISSSISSISQGIANVTENVGETSIVVGSIVQGSQEVTESSNQISGQAVAALAISKDAATSIAELNETIGQMSANGKSIEQQVQELVVNEQNLSKIISRPNTAS